MLIFENWRKIDAIFLKFSQTGEKSGFLSLKGTKIVDHDYGSSRRLLVEWNTATVFHDIAWRWLLHYDIKTQQKTRLFIIKTKPHEIITPQKTHVNIDRQTVI